MRALFDLLTDPYDRQARATPALMVVLPLLLPLVAHYGLKHPALTAVLAVLSSCGAVYTLSSIARGRGKTLETKLIAKWGGLPTTIALRHRDTHLDSVTKRVRLPLNFGALSPGFMRRSCAEPPASVARTAWG